MRCETEKRTRGFTLVELVIALSVGLIVIAALLSIVVLMNSYLIKRAKTTRLSGELYTVKQEISDWFYTYDNEKYRLNETSDALSFAYAESDSETLQYDAEKKKLITVSYQLEPEPQYREPDGYRTYSFIQEIYFTYEPVTEFSPYPDVVKCTVIYGADGETGEYIFILTRKSQYHASLTPPEEIP